MRQAPRGADKRDTTPSPLPAPPHSTLFCIWQNLWSPLSFLVPLEVANAWKITPILQMRKLSLREVMYLAWRPQPAPGQPGLFSSSRTYQPSLGEGGTGCQEQITPEAANILGTLRVCQACSSSSDPPNNFLGYLFWGEGNSFIEI